MRTNIVSTSPYFQVEVEWMITQRCNYSCTYCSSYDNNVPFLFKSMEQYKEGFSYLSKYFGNRTIKLDFLGGEPMLFKKWYELVNYISEVNYIPKITTNLSVPANTYADKLNPNIGRFITATWHPEFADTEQFEKNCDILYEKGFLNTISFAAPIYKWDKSLQIYLKFCEKYKHERFNFIKLIRIKYENTGSISIANKWHNYSEEQEKYFTDTMDYDVTITTTNKNGSSNTQINRLNATELDFKGMWCAVGRDRIHITPKGDVYPSACLLNYRKAVMGNIYKQNISKPKSAIRCPFTACLCGPDQRIEKWA
jgi:MoaA/NifB/PqqE/SkfB family radical SAM enzyme